MNTEFEKAITTALLGVVLVFIAIGIWVKWTEKDREAERHRVTVATYQAWVKHTGREDMTLQEWELLRSQRLLGNERPKK